MSRKHNVAMRSRGKKARKACGIARGDGRPPEQMKGSVEDIVIIGVVIFVLAIAALISYTVLAAFGSMPVIAANPTALNTVVAGLSAIALLGNSVIFLTVAFGLAAVISAFYTDTHPVFFVFSLMSFSICIMVISIFSQIFIDIANNSAFLPIAGNFYQMIQVITNFPIIGVMLGALILIALYTKRNDIVRSGMV
jgi:hypothetical protein